MALPAEQLDADDALVAAIASDIPGAEDERRVRSLLAAWWRYAGVRTAAGAVVDSDRFLAERSSLGLLELPVGVSRSVIELEFALLHNRSGMVALGTEKPALRLADDRAAEPVEWASSPALPAPVPLTALTVAVGSTVVPDRLPAVAAEPERAAIRIYAGLVVFFSLAVGIALAAAAAVQHVALPGSDAVALVAPWRAWLAIVTGVGGVLVATILARRATRGSEVLAGPRIGLGGLAITGLGLLAGSLATAGAGGAVLVGGAALGALRRR